METIEGSRERPKEARSSSFRDALEVLNTRLEMLALMRSILTNIVITFKM
jgi:hypothetical protein